MSATENYKGILLCERPPQPVAPDSGLTPFKPSSAPKNLDPVGLNPIKEVHLLPEREKKNSAMDKQKKFVKELERDMRDSIAEQERNAEEADRRRQQIQDFNSKLREKILNNDDVKTAWKPAAKAAEITERQQTNRLEVKTISESYPAALDPASFQKDTRPGKAAGPPSKVKQEMEDFVDSIMAEATMKATTTSKPAQISFEEAATPAPATPTQPEPSTSDAKPKKKKKSKSKPGWALTAGEAEELHAEEEEELLKFADELDFDKFISQLDDVELQDTLQALKEAEDSQATGDDKAWKKNFVRAMNHVQNKRVAMAAAARFGSDDEDDASVAGMSEGQDSYISRSTAASKARTDMSASTRAWLAERAAACGDKDWDRSTRASEDVGVMDKVVKSRQAEEFLRENPELRAVHSPASVRAALQKVESQAAAAESAA